MGDAESCSRCSSQGKAMSVLALMFQASRGKCHGEMGTTEANDAFFKLPFVLLQDVRSGKKTTGTDTSGSEPSSKTGLCKA
jgi:hypothetical protein